MLRTFPAVNVLLLSLSIASVESTNSTIPEAKTGNITDSAIIIIVVFLVIAIAVCACAIYLFVKGKNIEDIVEESIEDGDCCLGFDSDSRHSTSHLVRVTVGLCIILCENNVFCSNRRLLRVMMNMTAFS